MKKQTIEEFTSYWNIVRRIGKQRYIKKQSLFFAFKMFMVLFFLIFLGFNFIPLNLLSINLLVIIAICSLFSGIYLANLAWIENEKKYKKILKYFNIL